MEQLAEGLKPAQGPHDAGKLSFSSWFLVFTREHGEALKKKGSKMLRKPAYETVMLQGAHSYRYGSVKAVECIIPVP